MKNCTEGIHRTAAAADEILQALVVCELQGAVESGVQGEFPERGRPVGQLAEDVDAELL